MKLKEIRIIFISCILGWSFRGNLHFRNEGNLSLIARNARENYECNGTELECIQEHEYNIDNTTSATPN